MPRGVGVIVEIIYPGTFHGLHIEDKVVDCGGVIAVFQDAVLHAGLADGKFIDIGKGVGIEFEGDMVEGAVGKFDGEVAVVPGFLIDLRHAVEGVVVFVVVVGDVEAGAGGEESQRGQDRKGGESGRYFSHVGLG
jgi:hypothetical protein